MCNLVIKLEVSYKIGLPVPWSRGSAQQPQPQQAPQHEEAPAPLLPETASQGLHQQAAADQSAPNHAGSYEQSHQHLRSSDAHSQQTSHLGVLERQQLGQSQTSHRQQPGEVERWRGNATNSAGND